MVWPALAGLASRGAAWLAARPAGSFLAGTFVGDLVGGVVDAIPGIGGGGGGQNQQIIKLALLLGLVLSMMAAVSAAVEELI